jgi:adenylate kinase family enzyme
LAHLRSIDPPLVGIDGRCGAGKSTLGRYLSEQLCWPVYPLDDSLPGNGTWHSQEVVDAEIHRRKSTDVGLVVEGACLLRVVPRTEIGYLIFLDHSEYLGLTNKIEQFVDDYIREFDVRTICDIAFVTSIDEDIMVYQKIERGML